MKNFNIYIVCGAGVGTSQIMRMNVNNVTKNLDLPFKVTVDNAGLGSLAGRQKIDLIVTTSIYENDVKKHSDNVIVLERMMDREETKTKITGFFKKKGYLT